MPLQARQFVDLSADFPGHLSAPARKTLPLHWWWKSSKTETVAELDFGVANAWLHGEAIIDGATAAGRGACL